ncbi:bifunctional lysylphosphatidylglycerol flippase/synthetase MprF [Microbacterium sp. NPDC091382]|uniref:bifunctional lysylphosphatidylglycerol flippase/synthetase MprF n=1 Tax=Microbacterium sp. NPDC091382 TaxID=3364210 RepID=UPI00382474A6
MTIAAATPGTARRSALVVALRAAQSVPVTWAVTALVALASIYRFTRSPGDFRRTLDAIAATGFDTVLLQHDWLSVLTAVFFVPEPGGLLPSLLAVVIGVGWSERRMGHARTLAVFAGVTVLGIFLGLSAQALGLVSNLYGAQEGRSHHVFDPTIAVAGTVMAASAFASPLLRRRVRIVGFAILAVLVLYAGAPADQYRLGAGIVGVLGGVMLARRPLGLTRLRASRREARTLLAAVVAVTALGPVLSILAPRSTGVLNPLGSLFRDELHDPAFVTAHCETGELTRQCLDALALTRLDGPGAVLVTLLPLVALLLAARGIHRGRRVGLYLAIVLNALFAVLAAVYYGFLPLIASSEYARFQSAAAEEYGAFDLVATLVPAGLAAVLFLARPLFPRPSSGHPAARFILLSVLAFLGTSAVYLAVGWSVRDQFSPTATVSALVLDLPEHIIPVGFLAFEPVDMVATGPIASLVSQTVGPLFWALLIVIAWRGMNSRFPTGTGQSVARNRILGMLRGGSVGTLSWMTTWEGNSYWFAPGGGAVAYRVINDVAITTGDPICAAGRAADTADAFARWCALHGWTVAFCSVTDDFRAGLVRRGYGSIAVAEETVVRPTGWTLQGGKMKDVRTAVNRAEKEGLTASWVRFRDLTPRHAAQVRDISELWVAERDLPEMGFTLGGMDELRDDEVRLMIAVDGDDRVHAVTSWLPTYQDGRIRGWTLDFMRRAPDSMNGVMEFLIGRTILQAGGQGLDFVSLSGAPLAVDVDPGGQSATLRAVLAVLSRSLEPVYGFRSLLRFKTKFRPEFHRLHLVYADPLALPAIGLALARAYLPGLTARQAMRAFGRRSPSRATASR